MKLFVRSVFLAGLALLLVEQTARAGPFGYFTVSMFRPGCLYCDCQKPYNAFTPMAYNPAINRVAPAASVYPVPVASSGPVRTYAPLQSTGPVGCSSCGGGNVVPLNTPLEPIPAGTIGYPYPN